jgi:hypothetical protein
MMSTLVRWPDEADAVIKGDITAAAAYVTPAGGAVVTAVAPCGLGQQDRGMTGFTTALGFGKKLERIIREPHVALAYHSRDHGFSASPLFVLAQGMASVDLRPSPERVQAMVPQAERYVGKVATGPVWDRLLHEYYYERVFVDIALARTITWPAWARPAPWRSPGRSGQARLTRSRRRRAGRPRGSTSGKPPPGSPCVPSPAGVPGSGRVPGRGAHPDRRA